MSDKAIDDAVSEFFLKTAGKPISERLYALGEWCHAHQYVLQTLDPKDTQKFENWGYLSRSFEKMARGADVVEQRNGGF